MAEFTGRHPRWRSTRSRPLRLIYGFVCADASVIQPAAEDLSRVLEVAIQAYRRFHRDEEHLALEPTSGFPLRSVAAVTDRYRFTWRFPPPNAAATRPADQRISPPHPVERGIGGPIQRGPPEPDAGPGCRPSAAVAGSVLRRTSGGAGPTAAQERDSAVPRGYPGPRCPGANRVADTWCRRRRCGRPCPRDQRDDGGQVVRAGTLPAAELRRVGRRIRDRPGNLPRRRSRHLRPDVDRPSVLRPGPALVERPDIHCAAEGMRQRHCHH